MELFVTEPTLPVSFAPRPGESLRSYLIALAEANGYRNTGSFRHVIGLRNQSVSFASAQQWNLLARATGLPAPAFSEMRRRTMPSVHKTTQVSFLKSAVSWVHLDKVGHRICPQCLVEDRYGRDLWSLRYVVACPRHRTLLIDACHECGQPFGLYRWATLTGCTCGGDLAQSPTVRVDDGVVAAIATVAQIAGDGEACSGADSAALPMAFRSLTLSELLDCFHVLGTVVLAKTSRTPNRPRRDGSAIEQLLSHFELPTLTMGERLDILKAATSVMVDWPAALWRTLDKPAQGTYTNRL